jgi:hypothetical protein
LSTDLSRNVDQFDEWPLNKKQKGLQMNREKEEGKINLKKKRGIKIHQEEKIKINSI